MSIPDRSSGSFNSDTPSEEQPTTPAAPGAAEQPTLPNESAAFNDDEEQPTLPRRPPPEELLSFTEQYARSEPPAGAEGSNQAEQEMLPGESGTLSGLPGASAPVAVASPYASGALMEQPPPPDAPPWPTPSGTLPTMPGAPPWPIPSGSLPQFGQQPYAVVGQAVMTPSGLVIVSAAAKPPWYRALAKPLPFWARAVGSVLIAAALVATYFVRQGQGYDWADSLLAAGLVAGGLALLVLLATIARAVSGLAASTNPTRRRQLVSASILLGILLILAGEGIALQSPVHYFQGHTLEGQQQWERALAEYRLAGQRPPDSDVLARVYAEWGEQLDGQGRYPDALAKFEIVQMTYPQASAEVSRAQQDEIQNYLDWARHASGQQDYTDATSYYDTLLGLSFCAQSCRDQASTLDATAYYNLAEQYLTNSNYAAAVTTFQTLQSRFPDSPEAGQIHPDLAKALLGQGEQLRGVESTCSSAIPIFQQLIQNFSDTPQGQQAMSEYNAPEPVTGRFEGALAYLGGVPVAFLIKGLYIGIPGDQLFQLINSNGIGVPIDSSGTFTFKPIAQGTYDLVWGSVDQFGNAAIAYASQGDQLLYVATVGPLCTYDFGNIPFDVP